MIDETIMSGTDGSQSGFNACSTNVHPSFFISPTLKIATS